MALAFVENSADTVNFGSGASLDDLTTYTRLLWIKRTADTLAEDRVINKATWASGGWKTLAINANESITHFVMRATAHGNRGGSSLDLDAWNFLAAPYDETNGPRIFKGTLSALATEISYTEADATGTGATGADAAYALTVGYNADMPSNSAGVTIASVMVYNTTLTLAQIQTQQFTPRPIFTGCVLFSHLGFNGTGAQPDWSGNANAGTVTGATVADHVPLGRPYSLGANYVSYVSGVKRLLLLGAG